MARIPLQVGQRRLDTGSVVSYPSGSPVGSALEGAGNALQGVADHLRQKQEQKDAFDTTIRENEMAAALAGVEDEAIQSAPADASGLHDSVYGQIDPATNTAVKPGSFDALFDQYLERVPESKRQEFAAKREVYRLRGSARLAQQQYKGEQNYYNVEIAKTQNQITNAMAMGDPNDEETFEAFRKQGLDIIDKSGLPALEKDVARTNWLANADETLFKTKLAKDPEFATRARAALGLAPSPGTSKGAGSVVDRIIGVESGGKANAKNPNSSATGLGQFTSGTWMATIRKHAPEIAEGKSRAEVLALRNNPALSRKMTEALANDNAAALRAARVPVNDGTIYLAHFAGSQGAITLLRAAPDASVVSILGQKVVDANPFLKGKSASQVVAWAANKMNSAVPASVPADPAFANIPLDRRLVLANQADVQVGEIQRTIQATMKAEYTSHKDALELQIVQGQIRDEGLIARDSLLNDGDKATLIRSVRTQNEGVNQIASDFTALNDRSLVLDPYASKDKTRADNMYSDAAKRLPAEQRGAIAGAILEQTGIVPQPIVNAIRSGLSSTNVVDVVTAAQTAQRIATLDPAALARRDGGSEAQKAADDFGYYVNHLNLSPEEAARRLMEANDPEKKVERKAIEPAAKEFVKELQGEDVAALFNESWFSGSPELGFSPGQALGIQAEYLAIAEDQFYAANGDPDIARNRAVEEMKRLYGVTSVTGRSVVTKHPPEKYWPQFRIKEYGKGTTFGPESSLEYARLQLRDDLRAIDPDVDMAGVSLVTTPETDAMVKRGEMPAYSILYKDADGVLQTIPGKMWRPDIEAAREKQAPLEERERQHAIDRARSQQEVHREEIERSEILDERQQETGVRLRGAPLTIPERLPTPERESEPVAPPPATDFYGTP